MNNTIQEVSVDLHDWRDEQAAWNNRSKFFVELHNRADRKAQVTDFLSFLKDEHLLPPDDGTALDIGCGVGDYALGLARKGYITTGIDLSDGMIHGAKQLADTEGLDVSLYIAPWSEETRQTLGWDKFIIKQWIRLHGYRGRLSRRYYDSRRKASIRTKNDASNHWHLLS